MIEENQRKSKEKIELALQAIQDMLANKRTYQRSKADEENWIVERILL